MTIRATNLGTPAHAEGFSRRLRRHGMLLLACDADGVMSHAAMAHDREDWLWSLVCESPLVADELRRAAAQWRETPKPACLESIPGLWLAPIPFVQRRITVGYSVLVIPTGRFLESEQLVALCQTAQLDGTLIRKCLADLPPAAEADVPRLAALVEASHTEQLALSRSEETTESVSAQLSETYEEISLLYTIIQSMTEVERPEHFIQLTCRELLATLPYRWIGVLLSRDAPGLSKVAGQFVSVGRAPAEGPMLRPLMERLLERYRTGQVLEPGTSPDHAEFAVLGRPVLVQPIHGDQQPIGVFVAAGKEGRDLSASSADTKLLGAAASHTKIFLENAALYEELNATFVGTLEALTASIDAKDRYTCGHSERVALLTQRLAEAAGLDQQFVTRTRIAGLVHDVGKIGVPERILVKPGQLTDEEFAWVKKHPEIGYGILKDIPQFADILGGVLHHHERWDGKGYPDGLAGEDIPLLGRMIALADSFDAMSSDRTYRARLGRTEVLSEILRCTGTQFDPGLGPLFTTLDFTEYDALVLEHGATESETA